MLSLGALTWTTSTDALRPNPEDSRHLDSDIPPEVCMRLLVSSHERKAMFQPLAPADDATRDPLLRHKIHGVEIKHVRIALAFTGITLKSPRAVDYMRADRAFDNLPSVQHVAKDTVRGRPLVRGTRIIGLGRVISM